ncbi:FG-GAP-like repeat-containing protein [Hymenobacter sp.]|uniref:FG-GAP-like repeat-containing protein n=1 Tax=Hymenobacter sp. TaxID=1898978 RepID=UPI002ED9AE50
MLTCVSYTSQYAHAQQGPPIVIQPGATVTLPTGAAPSAVAVADFNADNRFDVAVCERGLNQVAIYLQTAAGTYPSPVNTYPAGQSPSGLVATRLTNQPNRPPGDLIALSGPSSKWTLLYNDGNGQGSFTEVPATGAFGTGQVSVNPQLVAANIDRNLYVDVAYTYDGPNQGRVKWDSYAGAGHFNGGSYYDIPFAPASLALDDFDRDGFTDVVYTDPLSNQFWVLFALQSNPPVWNAPAELTQIPSAGIQPIHAATGDVNRDFQPDIVVANAGSNNLVLFLNVGAYQFGSPFAYTLSAAPRKVLLEDLNGDSSPEMLVITADNQLQVFQHTGALGIGRYGAPQLLATGVNPTTLQTVDVNGDTVKDIVVGCVGDNTVRMYLNRSLQPMATRAPQLTGLSVFPSPATDQLQLHASRTIKGPLVATLLDNLGRTVRQLEVQPDISPIPVADLPRGFYTLRVVGKEGTYSSKIMLK